MPANKFLRMAKPSVRTPHPSSHLVKLGGEENSTTLPWSRQIEVSGVV
jgi:hypothetical protein